MTGTLSPDVTGTYDTVGWLNNQPYAKCTTAESYIWWNTVTEKWILSLLLGIIGGSYWIGDDGFIGTYQPSGTATGVATIAKGVFP